MSYYPGPDLYIGHKIKVVLGLKDATKLCY